MILLKNIKKTLHNNNKRKHFYEATNMEFTIRTLPPDKRSEISSLVNSNPLEDRVFSNVEKEHELNVLCMAHGVEEFNGDEELAREYLTHDGFGESNKHLLIAIREINPPLEERVKDLVVVMAFSPEEVRLVNAIMDTDSKKELTTYLADNDNIIEAINFCKEFFMALGTAHAISQEHSVPMEFAFLILAKNVLQERKLIPEEEIAKMPDMPKPNVDINVHQQGR